MGWIVVTSAGSAIVKPPLGCAGCRLSAARAPPARAAFLSSSFRATRALRSSRHFEGITCSTRTLRCLLMMRPLTCLATRTPTARLVTL